MSRPADSTTAAPELAGSLARLTGELHTLMDQLADSASRDLQQAGGLLSEAVADLDRCFSSIGSQTRAEQQHLAELLAHCDELLGEPHATADGGLREVRARLAAGLESISDSNSAIHDNVAVAVRALQFEDMVRQVLEHVAERLAGLRQVTGGLARQVQQLQGGRPVTDWPAQLERLGDELASAGVALRADDHRAVSQTSLEAGDIELF